MKVVTRSMSLLIGLLGALSTRANCPTPVSSNGWNPYSSVQYDFEQGYGGCGQFCSIAWSGIPSTQQDVQTGAGLWTTANLTQNSTAIVFRNGYCCSPLRFFAYQVEFPGDPVLDPGKAAQTTIVIFSGTNAVAQATIQFYFGSLDPLSGAPFYDSGASTYDGFISKVTLHEIGHTMGLRDQPTTPYAYCGGQTPGESVMNGGCGTNDSSGNLPTNVTSCDNQSCY